MKSRLLAIVGVFIMSLFVFVAPSFSLAQEQEENEGLVSCTGVDCDFCDVMITGYRVINLLFEVLIVAAVVMIVVAGFKLVTSAGNVSAKESAKGMLTNVIIGFVIVLAAWLIVDTIYKMLVGEDSEFGMWNQLDGSDCGGARNQNTSPTQSGVQPLYCYTTTQNPTIPTNIRGLSQCESSRQQAISGGQNPGPCQLCSGSGS